MQLIPLPQSFYRPSASVIARRLLGHWLIRRTPKGICGGPIVETEAYIVGDAASHGFRGETARNRIMFGPPGHAYVYFIYGNHCCVNAVCRGLGSADAVLIRAVEVEFGEDIMRQNRPVEKITELTNGPGKLCAAMGIDRHLNGADLFAADSPLMIACNPGVENFREQRGPVIVTTRIGITRAAELPLRFYLEGSLFISKRSRSAGLWHSAKTSLTASAKTWLTV